ncbi:hypothetical protein J2Y86_000596 [Pseudomonas migulae]|jgi:hypothetical protein|nr:hypothetical protein [Pseudomonas migulae]MDR6919125.1 hypothetical protein [Pseudomonas sp. 3296]
MLMIGADPQCDTPVMVKLVVDAEVREVLFYRSCAVHLGLHLIVSVRRHTIEIEGVYMQVTAPPR